MKKYIIVLVTLLLIIGCSFDCRIKNLDHRQLNYSELPEEVKDCLAEAFEANFSGEALFVNKEDSTRYCVEDIWNCLVHSWLDYVRVVDKKKNKNYRIEQDMPEPFLFYNDRLFIFSEYNAMINGDFENYNYIEYQLK